ncbi:hypothetical protein LQZ19_18390 [Treponema primitia]|uniref:hypothetical protein n=1 Tax=Treponema primitia TaxID=88058 RepID=UPI00397FFF4A
MLAIKTTYLILAIIFLFLGIAIYMSFRNSDILLYHWFFKPSFIDSLYKPVNTEISFIKSLFVYNLPDGLWFLSGTLFIRFIWIKKINIHRLYFIIFTLMAIVLEIIQLNKNVPGTFDVLDLFFMGIGALVEGIIYNVFVRRRII